MSIMNRRHIVIAIIVVIMIRIGWFLVDQSWNNFEIYKSLAERRDLKQKKYTKYEITNPNSTQMSIVNITVVTAFFDLGTFRKGPPGQYFSEGLYNNWSRIFRYLKNPLVVYTDSVDFKLHMMAVRNESMKNTAIFLIERSSSWAFQNVNKIHEIFSEETYPEHYPNTVISAYTCAQHAKFDAVERAAKSNIFRTKYYMWLDIGYFRERNSRNAFYLTKPVGFVDSKIAMNLVHSYFPLSLHPEDIIKKNFVLVAGGLVFGERERTIKFAAQFRRAVGYFLAEGWSNTDQQIIFAMFSNDGRKLLKPEVELQIYTSQHENDWFYLGKTMVREVVSYFYSPGAEDMVSIL